MKITQYLSFLLLSPVCSVLALSGMDFMDFYDELSGRLSCPSPEEFVAENPEYPIDCVKYSIPPWPLCLFHNVTYFIQGAVASADRCCDFGNLEECRCPFKNNTKWQEVMTKWCAKIDTCPTDISVSSATVMGGKAGDSVLGTDVWSKFLLDDYVDSLGFLDEKQEEESEDGEDDDEEFGDDDEESSDEEDGIDEDEYYDE